LTSIIVVTWNNLRYTKECIEFVQKYTDAPYELIIVDNASTDGTPEWLKTIGAIVIENGENEGFSKAVNKGLAVAKGEYVFLLNNDLLVPPHWLSTLIKHIETLPNAAAVGPMGCAIGSKQDYAAIYGEAPWDGNPHNVQTFIDFTNKLNTKYSGDFTEAKSLSGACMLIRADIFQELGLDEGCRMGADDADLSLELRLKGYRLYVAEDVLVYHYNHVTFKLLDTEAQDKSANDSWDHFNHKWRNVEADWDTLFENEDKWHYDGLFKNRRGYAESRRYRS